MKLASQTDSSAPELAAQYPVSHPYTNGKSHNAVSVGGSANSDVTLDVSNYEWLTLEARMTAGAAGDLAVEVRAFEDDGTTVFDVVLPADAAVAPALNGGVSRAFQRIRLGGISKVQIRVKNANVGAQTATAVYHLSK